MPHYSNDKNLIGNIFRAQVEEQEKLRWSNLEIRLRELKSKLREAPDCAQAYLDLADCYRGMDDHLKAVDTLEEAARRLTHDEEIHYSLIQLLQKCGLDDEAIEAGKRACSRVPNDFALRLEYELYLPKLYDSEPEIYAYHQRFTEGLEKCIAACDLTTREGALRAARGFSRYANFYLAYQGYDDLPLIRRYGEFVQRVMSAAYPRWSKVSDDKPIRDKPLIGYISAYFREHTVGKHFLGWLTQRNRRAYEVHCYYAGETCDAVTEAYRRASDTFFQSRNLEVLCSAIERDHPDVLVFTDVGTHPLISQIAALRLASVQCVTWGHPVTTGLPTIDYFISSELMEPPESQQHYSERLVKLPNLGIYYTKPVIPRALLTKTRSTFGLPDDSVIYLCCQSQFKYLPQYDHLLAKIATAVPNALFLFLAPNELRSAKFLRRLAKAFSLQGIRVSDFCRVLPEQSLLDYWNLHFICDVFLDTPAWSGGRTTLEAATCGLPVVTMTGSAMRFRQTSALLSRLGIPMTIAANETEYIAIATFLGRQAQSRSTLGEMMKASAELALPDQSTVLALGSFFASAWRSALRV
jgi:predicted O-linked N-acetylglucosamine transferase (SPINDLY family)